VGWADAYDANRRIGVEAAWLRGPLSVQGEIAALRGSGSNSLSGEGAYVQASWLTDGAARSFRDGAVRGPKLESGRYPVEFSARVSRVDFDLGSRHLVAQTLYSIGASAFIGRYVRISLERNWIAAERSSALSRTGEFDGDVTTARLQLSF
jgi:phosphate-selective porin